MYSIAQTVEVSLPRFRLSFFVNTDMELECRIMPGYVVDETQTRGTMFGLTNKLILRPTKSEDFLLPRRVIIPQGEVSFRTNGDFITVSVDTGIKEHTSWHEYTIDVDLGCLTNNTSLRTKLYQCYLHAITSTAFLILCSVIPEQKKRSTYYKALPAVRSKDSMSTRRTC